MSTRSNNDEIERTLSALENLKSAEPSEGFDDRLFARLASIHPERADKWLPWIKWSVAALLVLSITNGIMIFQQRQTSDELLVSELWTQADDGSDYLDYFIEQTQTPEQP